MLFPEAILPLHVFEPRYIALVRDALASDRLFAMALLKPGYEKDYEGNPGIYPIGCEGRIEEAVPLPDGRCVLTLKGTRRVELREMVRSSPYRIHIVRYPHEPEPVSNTPAAKDTLLRMLSAWQQIVGAVAGRSTTAPLPTGLPMTGTVNRIAFGLDVDPIVKYRLLETGDPLARAEALAALLESELPRYLDLGGESPN